MNGQAIAEEVANERGVISTDESDQMPSVNINIRQDDLKMFETQTGRQLLRTPDMISGMYIEPIPTAGGFVAEVVEPDPSVNLTEIEPADPKEQPSIRNGSDVEIRMD